MIGMHPWRVRLNSGVHQSQNTSRPSELSRNGRVEQVVQQRRVNTNRHPLSDRAIVVWRPIDGKAQSRQSWNLHHIAPVFVAGVIRAVADEHVHADI